MHMAILTKIYTAKSDIYNSLHTKHISIIIIMYYNNIISNKKRFYFHGRKSILNIFCTIIHFFFLFQTVSALTKYNLLPWYLNKYAKYFGNDNETFNESLYYLTRSQNDLWNNYCTIVRLNRIRRQFERWLWYLFQASSLALFTCLV